MNLLSYFAVYNGLVYFYFGALNTFDKFSEDWYNNLALAASARRDPEDETGYVCVDFLQFAAAPVQGKLGFILCWVDDQGIIFHLVSIALAAFFSYKFLDNRLVEVMD